MPEDQQSYAHQFMLAIMTDNGAINCNEPPRYPEPHLSTIQQAAEVFFTANLNLAAEIVCEGIIDLIATGENTMTEALFGHLPGYKELDTALAEYFDQV